MKNNNNSQMKNNNNSEMKNNYNSQMKKSIEQVADVPNPPVPNRAHTEMKDGKKCTDKCNINYDKK